MRPWLRVARQVELEQARLSYGCPITIILDPATDTRDVRQILLDHLFSFGRRSGRLCGMRADNFLAGPRSSSSSDRPRKMRKYGRAVAEIEVEAVVGGMLNRTLMPVLSVSRKRPPDKLPPGIKETADLAVTALQTASGYSHSFCRRHGQGR